MKYRAQDSVATIYDIRPIDLSGEGTQGTIQAYESSGHFFWLKSARPPVRQLGMWTSGSGLSFLKAYLNGKVNSTESMVQLSVNPLLYGYIR